MDLPNAKPTALNLFFLSVMLGPGDPNGWKKYKESARKQKYYRDNLAHISLRNKTYRDAHKTQTSVYHANYRQENKESILIYSNEYNQKRTARDPQYRLRRYLRSRLSRALRAQGVKKEKRTDAFLGAALETTCEHLERSFQPGMSWDNYGMWHVDHIRPCASFDLRDPAQAAACFHYTNLQPLWAIDNLKKGDKWK